MLACQSATASSRSTVFVVIVLRWSLVSVSVRSCHSLHLCCCYCFHKVLSLTHFLPQDPLFLTGCVCVCVHLIHVASCDVGKFWEDDLSRTCPHYSVGKLAFFFIFVPFIRTLSTRTNQRSQTFKRLRLMKKQMLLQFAFKCGAAMMERRHVKAFFFYIKSCFPFLYSNA